MNENNNNADYEKSVEETVRALKDGTEKKYDPQKRRNIIKNILIVFLAVLLVLTFCSNTIMNRSLAEISTEMTSSGKLTERIRGSGMIESNQSYEVKVDGNKVVDTICIKSGQEVQKDDVLFTIGTGESAELTEAESALNALKLEYEKSLLVVPLDYSAENQAIKNAREDYNEAVAKRDEAKANEPAAQAAKEQYNQNKLTLSQKTSLQEKLTTAITAIDSDSYTGAPAEYIGNLPSMYSSYSDAEAAYMAAEQYLNSLTMDPEADVDLSAAEADVQTKKADMDYLKSVYDNEKASVRPGVAEQLSTLETEIMTLNADIAAYESDMQTGEGAVTIEALEADVQTKQRALEDLIIALEKTQREDSVTSQIASLDVEAKKAEIEKQQDKVDKLKKEVETTEIKSKYSGVVSAVNIKPGETTIPDTPLAVIDITAEGYTVKISVDGEKAKKIKTGAQAEVINNWSGDVQAILTEIKNDTVSGSKNRMLVFDVTGDVDSGSSLDLSIPCGSGNYDVIVPKSAVYEDKNGKFVLTVTSKSSPLGNRYYAQRVDVEVLASDETSCAVSGDITSGTYVITAASKPVAPGDQVRMKD